MDVYEGFDPRDRWQNIEERIVYPTAHAYECAGEYEVILIWIIISSSKEEFIVEKLKTESFLYLQENPTHKYLWIKGTFDVKKMLVEKKKSFLGNPYASENSFLNSNHDDDDFEANIDAILAINTHNNPIDLTTENKEEILTEKKANESNIIDENFHKQQDPLSKLRSKNVPSNRLKYEQEKSLTLGKLYDEPLTNKKVTISVGGRNVVLCAFHYPAENLSAPENNIKREYVDESETILLYRWELKGALCTKLQSVKI
jgi:hypothetical protein